MWGSRFEAAASTIKNGNTKDAVVVPDISSTTVFSSESAVSRRGLIRGSGFGSFVILEYGAGNTSIYRERIKLRQEIE